MPKIIRADATESTQSAASAPSIADLQVQLDAANARITQLTAAQVQQTEKEKNIASKMARGLTRAQAIAVIERQEASDATPLANQRAAKVTKFQAAQKS